jgi:1,4-alpha-glucan branching enzyme
MAKAVASSKIPQAHEDGNVTFRLEGHESSREVFVSGSFNEWHSRQLPMTKSEGGWVVRVKVPPGRHKFEFLIDGEPVLDPGRAVAEENGRKRSILIVD